VRPDKSAQGHICQHKGCVLQLFTVNSTSELPQDCDHCSVYGHKHLGRCASDVDIHVCCPSVRIISVDMLRPGGFPRCRSQLRLHGTCRLQSLCYSLATAPAHDGAAATSKARSSDFGPEVWLLSSICDHCCHTLWSESSALLTTPSALCPVSCLVCTAQ